MTRKLSLVLAIALFCTVFTGIGAVSADTAGETPVITIMCAEPTTVEDIDTNYATLYIEERLGVDLQFNFLPSTEWATKLQVMVTAGDKLSDVLFGTTSESIVSAYGADGTFIDLTELYENNSVYIKAVFDENPAMKALSTFADGKMYAVTRLQQQTHTDFGHKQWLNQTWLDNLNLEQPQTLDEFTEVLRAFRDLDANGNGDPSDEIPLTGSTTAGSTYNPILFLMGSFTFVNTRHYFQVEDGQLSLAYTKDEWRKGLEYCRMLYEEGLLDPNVFTQDLNSLKALMQTEGDIVVGAADSMNVTHLFSGSENTTSYYGTAPYEGPEGVRYSPYTTYSLTYNSFITKDCADPELAFSLLDLTWDLDTSMAIRFGEENVDWRWMEAGEEKTQAPYAVEGFPVILELLSGVQTGVQNKWWNVWSGLYLPYSIGDGQPLKPETPTAYENFITPAIVRMSPYIPDEIAGKITYTTEESNQIAEILANLDTYWRECMALFVIGDMDLDADWDEYLATLEDYGIQEYIDVSQVAYTRTYGGK